MGDSTWSARRDTSTDMDPYTSYKARSAELLIEHSMNLVWSAEEEQVGEETLGELWERLTPEEKQDLSLWLETQTHFSL